MKRKAKFRNHHWKPKLAKGDVLKKKYSPLGPPFVLQAERGWGARPFSSTAGYIASRRHTRQLYFPEPLPGSIRKGTASQ